MKKYSYSIRTRVAFCLLMPLIIFFLAIVVVLLTALMPIIAVMAMCNRMRLGDMGGGQSDE